jgi:hypothetical protein
MIGPRDDASEFAGFTDRIHSSGLRLQRHDSSVDLAFGQA